MPTTGLFTWHLAEFVIRRTFFHQISRVPSTCDSLKAYCMGSRKMCHCMFVRTCDFSTMAHHLIYTCGRRSSGPTIWATVDRSRWPDCLACTFSRLDPASLLPGGHMKSFIYETPGASEEDLLARVMGAADVGGQGSMIVSTRTLYGGTESVLTSVLVISSPSCKWTETTSSRSHRE